VINTLSSSIHFKMTFAVKEVVVEPYVVNDDDESLFDQPLISPEPVKQSRRGSLRRSRMDEYSRHSPTPNAKTRLSSSSCRSHISSEDATEATVSSSSCSWEDETDDSSMFVSSPSKQLRPRRRRSSTSSSSKSSSKQYGSPSLDVVDSNNNDDDVRSIRSKGLPKKHRKERRRSSGASSRSSISSAESNNVYSTIMHCCDEEDASISFSVVGATDSKPKTATRRSSSSSGSKRVISFNKRGNVRAIPQLKSLSEEEKSKVWYREAELKAIKQEALDLMKRVKDNCGDNNADNDDDEKFCVRGLGGSIGRPGSPQNRRSNWMMALTCVLDEQERQKECGISDPEHMAKLYRAFAVYSQQYAVATGRQGAKEVGTEELS
jgi:hypothetical protein